MKMKIPISKQFDPAKISSDCQQKAIQNGAYFKALIHTLQEIDQHQTSTVTKIEYVLYETWRAGGRVFTLGNGGSATNASQIATDMSKRTRVDTMPFFDTTALTDNATALTAYSNDEGYIRSFVGQLECKRIGKIDTIIALSGSGNSPNVLAAVKYAKKQNANIIGLTGFDGGKLSKLADVSFIVPQKHLKKINSSDAHGPVMAGTEDVHMIILHSIFETLREKILEARRQIK
jgi:D-sedoheptulose 7-phosphate isomerase